MAKRKSECWCCPEGLLLLSGWARDGLTDEDIAKNMGIATSTLYEWKKRYLEISEALKESKEIADRIVENALFKRATGYEKKTIKVFQYHGDPITVPITEQVEPDTTAAIFWLKNRKPSEWRDKPIIDEGSDCETGVVILPMVLNDLEPPED